MASCLFHPLPVPSLAQTTTQRRTDGFKGRIGSSRCHRLWINSLWPHLYTNILWFGLFVKKKLTAAERQEHELRAEKQKPHGADKNISPRKRKEGSSPAKTPVSLFQLPVYSKQTQNNLKYATRLDIILPFLSHGANRPINQ